MREAFDVRDAVVREVERVQRDDVVLRMRGRVSQGRGASRRGVAGEAATGDAVWLLF